MDPAASEIVFNKVGDKEEECWDRIKRQYDSMDVFVQKNSDRVKPIIGDWFYRKAADLDSSPIETSKQGKFFLALAKAGQLVGLKNSITKDESEAIRLLLEVIEEDPDNSAPLLYLASLYQARGQLDLAEKYFLKTNSTKRFDSYLTDFTKAVFSTVNTSGDLMVAISIWSTTPIPDYKSIKDMIIKNKSEKIAQQMVEKALNPQNDYRDINWVVIEYAYGKSLLDKLGKGSQIPKTKELLKNKKDFADSLVGFSELEQTCDINSLNSDVIKIQQYFNR